MGFGVNNARQRVSKIKYLVTLLEKANLRHGKMSIMVVLLFLSKEFIIKLTLSRKLTINVYH